MSSSFFSLNYPNNYKANLTNTEALHTKKRVRKYTRNCEKREERNREDLAKDDVVGERGANMAAEKLKNNAATENCLSEIIRVLGGSGVRS